MMLDPRYVMTNNLTVRSLRFQESLENMMADCA